MGRPAGLPWFGQAVAPASLLVNPNRFSYRVDPPGQAGFNNTGDKGQSIRVCMAFPASLFESVVMVAFQSAFRAKMYQNDVFLFFKNYF
jgi:hypothetical protein